MKKPIISDIKPKKGEDYFYCTCGKSSKQPFCDGSHRDTNFTPKKFTAEDDGDASFCQCKNTKTAPFCDGYHKDLNVENIGKESTSSSETQEVSSTPKDPHVAYIHELAKNGLSEMSSMA